MARWSNTVSKRLLPGRKGTVTTLRVMSRMARAGSGHPAVVKTAQDVMRQVPERDHEGEISAMLSYVRSAMRYTRDPLDTETIKAAEVMVGEIEEHGQFVGDCDDASVLLAALLGAVGYATDFKVAGADRSRPREPSHVWVAVRHPRKGWIALDPIVRDFDVGQEMPEEHIVGSRGRIGATRGDSQMYGLRSGMGDIFENAGDFITGLTQNELVNQYVRSKYPVRTSGSERVAILQARTALERTRNDGRTTPDADAMTDTMRIALIGVGVVALVLVMKKR